VRLILDLDLPDALGVELETAAKRCGIAPPMWAAQTIESELASQRLPKVAPGRYGARMICEGESVLTEHKILLPEKD
jgi:hypothetical protein